MRALYVSGTGFWITVARLPHGVSTRELVDRCRARWPELAVVLAVAWAFHPTITGGDHLPYDAEFFHFPLLRSVLDLIAGGHLPAWDPDTYGGIPLLANAQSAWEYPPHLLLAGWFAISGGHLTQHVLNLVAVLHVAIAGLFTVALARSRGLGNGGAAFAGGFAVLAGGTVSQAQHMLMTETYAWLPAAWLALDRLALGVTRRRVAALAATVLLMVTPGFLPLIPACMLFLVGAAVLRSKGRRDALVGLAAGVALGAGLAAAALLPVAALAGVFPQLDIHGALPSSFLGTTVLPNAVGHWASPAGFTGIELTNSYFYLGGAAVVLLPLGLLAGRRGWWEAALALLITLAAFGAIAGHIATALQSIPRIGPLWRPEDAAYIIPLPLGLLLGRGLSVRPSRSAIVTAIGALVLVSLVPIAGAHGDLHFPFDAPAQTVAVAGVALVGAALAAFVAVGRRRPAIGSLALIIVAILALADLATAVTGRYFINSSGPATSAGPNNPGYPSDVLTFLRTHLAPGQRVDEDVSQLPASFVGFPPVWGVSDANGFQPQSSRYQIDRVAAFGLPIAGGRHFPVTPAIEPYFREMNVRYLVVSAGQDPFAGNRDFPQVFRDSLVAVHATPAGTARARWLDPTCVTRDPAADQLGCVARGTVTVDRIGRGTVTLGLSGVHASHLLATGEVFYPGWSATSPKGSLPVRRVGYQAAVQVPAGISRVTLHYSPPGFVLGVVLSVLSLLLLAVLAWPPELGYSRR